MEPQEEIEAEILLLSSNILMGKASEKDIKRVTKLAIDNDCQDILKREFTSIQKTLTA